MREELKKCVYFLAILFYTSVFANDYINPLIPSLPQADYLLNFTEEGKPKRTFTESFIKRFGEKLNYAIPMEGLEPEEQKKWLLVFDELKHVADRTVSVLSELLFIPQEKALNYSELFESTGEVQVFGAWSIAVRGTAVRHGFAHVPCAEFMSEMIRQAYKRAGYDFRMDFNSAQDNELIWHKTAAVVNLTTALFKGGWIPWDPSQYKPPTGAPMMHARAAYPGHTYIAAGEDGRFIVDNGAPRGRDLRVTSNKIIKMQYLTGVFFLPPGILPETW